GVARGTGGGTRARGPVPPRAVPPAPPAPGAPPPRPPPSERTGSSHLSSASFRVPPVPPDARVPRPHHQRLDHHETHQHAHQGEQRRLERQAQLRSYQQRARHHDREPRRDAGRPDQQESVRPHGPHQPPPEPPLHGERDPQREPDGWSVVRRQHEAKEEGCRGNRRHADQVTTGRRHGPSLSAFESSRLRADSVPPKPSSAPRLVTTRALPALPPTH